MLSYVQITFLRLPAPVTTYALTNGIFGHIFTYSEVEEKPLVGKHRGITPLSFAGRCTFQGYGEAKIQ